MPARRPKAKAMPPRRQRARRQRPDYEAGSLRVMSLPTMQTSTHGFTRSVAPVLVTKPTGVDATAMMTFTFADLPNYTEFTSLYDRYRITRIDLRFLITVSGITNVRLYVTSDFDGGAVPDMNAICQSRHIEKTLSVDNPEAIFSFKPRIANTVGSSTGSAISGITAPWLDLATTNIVHYGASYVAFNYNVSNANAALYISETFHFECSGLR